MYLKNVYSICIFCENISIFVFCKSSFFPQLNINDRLIHFALGRMQSHYIILCTFLNHPNLTTILQIMSIVPNIISPIIIKIAFFVGMSMMCCCQWYVKDVTCTYITFHNVKPYTLIIFYSHKPLMPQLELLIY